MMKKRLQIGKLLKGDTRLDGETFVEYKERLKLEKSLLNDYGKGVYISPEQHQQDVVHQVEFVDKNNLEAQTPRRDTSILSVRAGSDGVGPVDNRPSMD